MSHIIIQKKQKEVAQLSSELHRLHVRNQSLKNDLTNKSHDLKQCNLDVESFEERKSQSILNFTMAKLKYEREFLQSELLKRSLRDSLGIEGEWRSHEGKLRAQSQRARVKADIERADRMAQSHTLEDLYSFLDHTDDTISKLKGTVREAERRVIEASANLKSETPIHRSSSRSSLS